MRSTTWSLVLCFERCFKEEYAQTMELLKKRYCRKKSGQLLCFKSVDNLQKWMCTNTMPYVLVVGWREAKPLSSVVMCWRPESLFVLAEKDVSTERAATWAAQNSAMLISSLNQLPGKVNSLSDTKARPGMQCSQNLSGYFSTVRRCEDDVIACLKNMQSQVFPVDLLSCTSDLYGLVRQLNLFHGKEVEAILRAVMPISYED
eukprot:TRINITY_DN106774_c0_g1_i1.p1 TRINITY_DN106774_c0_g1~~TRINITY_DN106774_c0_g1_i1.p1  ORF type:complete len:203 (-),score=32.24 TRINITY_DN106774_c0_g1_i1:99-707(-)